MASTAMPTPVLMPQMGESIAEGTIVRWIKRVGEAVDLDEPLFEISTDKVDAEIPSPVAGVLSEIHVKEGETVAVNSVVATIGDKGPAADRPIAPAGPVAAATEVPGATPQPDGSPSPKSKPEREEPRATPRAGVEARANGAEAVPTSKEDQRRAKSSPLVRKIAREHNVNIGAIHGSGVGGRVTKHDILGYLEHRPEADTEAPVAGRAPSEPVFQPGESLKVVPMSVMRKKIADHMVMSRRTSAHVHTV